MDNRQSNASESEIHLDDGMENRGYTRSQSDHQIMKSDGDDHHLRVLRTLRANSAAASTIPVIYELPIVDPDLNQSKPMYNTISPLIVSPTKMSYLSTAISLQTTPSSIPDPMSDRVSTILVWQHLTVSTRGDQQKGLMKRLLSFKSKESKRKVLLHHVSGAITGGLWAVMGNFHHRFLSV